MSQDGFRLLSSQKSRLDALKKRHAILSARIDEARKSPSVNDFFVQLLNIQILSLKDEIEGIREMNSGRASA